MASNMKIKKKSSEKTFDIINGAFLLILVILVAYPLYYVLIASISDPYEVYAGKTFLLPSKITFEGYKRVFKENSIAGGYLNSIYYTVLGTVVSVALVLTTGGTGFSKRDVTPEATLAVADRNAPGIAEAIRAYSLTITPRAMLSRGASVIRKQTLIVNLPGSPKAVKESLGFILDSLDHGLKILRGSASECARRD